MTINVRRVVTGHDETGKAIVNIDDVSPHVVVNRPNIRVINLWSNSYPVSNTDIGDCAEQIKATVLPGGALFRVIEFQPGVAPRMHRTDTLDYIVVMSGSITMEMDDALIELHAGDVMVQRGTVHNWVNNGTESCVCAFVMMAAEPIIINGKQVEAHG
ncbi:cupin domain-containing protein [Sphingobium sp. MK2]|jgi:quercetin dioxygenase-like cupin family protein|uniref:cupin domain-containing protein n=1 Tax=Sphingobium sp. MK2 TaxID=3116540 RepID=UPI0032E367A2